MDSILGPCSIRDSDVILSRTCAVQDDGHSILQPPRSIGQNDLISNQTTRTRNHSREITHEHLNRQQTKRLCSEHPPADTSDSPEQQQEEQAIRTDADRNPHQRELSSQKSARSKDEGHQLDHSDPESSFISKWLSELPETFPEQIMHLHRLAERRSAASLQRKRSISSGSEALTTPSGRISIGEKSAKYAQNSYEVLLRSAGVLLTPELRVSGDIKTFCENLLSTECRIPIETLFDDLTLGAAIAELANRNEARVIQDIARLLVPSVQTMAKTAEQRYLVFVESVNEAWNCCFPLLHPRPQPDYAVGFGRDALTERRISKLHPLIRDDPLFESNFTATFYMYFPFFTIEVKSGTQALVVADRQNAHSMGIAVQGILHLHRLAGKESLIHNTLVAFSVSHNHRMVRLTGWGPVIDGDFFTVQPLLIHVFDVTAGAGRDRWTSRKFTIGVYEYGLQLLQRINNIIDELPSDLNLVKVRPLTLGVNPESQEADGPTFHGDVQE